MLFGTASLQTTDLAMKNSEFPVFPSKKYCSSICIVHEYSTLLQLSDNIEQFKRCLTVVTNVLE